MKQEKRRKLPLLWQLMAIIMAFLLLLMSITLSITMHYSLRTFQGQIDSVLMSTVVTLANQPAIVKIVEQGYIDQQMSDYLTDVVVNTENMQFITIADKHSIRIYHVEPALIGLPFEGGDEGRALEGEIYISDASPLNYQKQRRAFHPVLNENEEVIGFVMSSATFEKIDQLRQNIYDSYGRLMLILICAALAICIPLALYLGRRLRGVKPDDLLRMYLTQNDILNATDDGLLSFDTTGRVRLVNASAARMLGQREDLLVGQQVDDLIRAKDGSSLRSREHQILQSSRPNILVKPVQLPNAHLWARQVLILSDKSEVTRYAEELTGTRHMLSTLRANTHEFLNKLQVISGMLQMGHTDDAQRFIGSIAADHEQITAPVMQRIHNTGLAALILGKSSRMRELSIELLLTNTSHIPEQSRYLSTNELVTVVGNLMENAIEAIEAVDSTQEDRIRAVRLDLNEDEKGLLIMISDSGTGISDQDLPLIYEPGFSTKAAKGRGVGMSLVKRIVESHGATIDVETEPGFGTTFTIILNRERGGTL